MECVYRGGQAAGVVCSNPGCRATNTTGSWRKGWALEGEQAGSYANLCNRWGVSATRWAAEAASGSAGAGLGERAGRQRARSSTYPALPPRCRRCGQRWAKDRKAFAAAPAGDSGGSAPAAAPTAAAAAAVARGSAAAAVVALLPKDPAIGRKRPPLERDSSDSDSDSGGSPVPSPRQKRPRGVAGPAAGFTPAAAAASTVPAAEPAPTPARWVVCDWPWVPQPRFVLQVLAPEFGRSPAA